MPERVTEEKEKAPQGPKSVHHSINPGLKSLSFQGQKETPSHYLSHSPDSLQQVAPEAPMPK